MFILPGRPAQKLLQYGNDTSFHEQSTQVVTSSVDKIVDDICYQIAKSLFSFKNHSYKTKISDKSRSKINYF